MCGLVAILERQGIPDGALLARMAERIAHRGPDDEGQAISGGVGLHHKRLSIIDLSSGGHQPMARDGVTVVFNGEIYNYVELRDELAARGHGFSTQSDTEVLLHMYLEHGPDCVAQLNGMFAFVLHDARRNLCLVARDHFGIKPLYWWRDASRILYASEIKALLVHPAVPRRLDQTALEDYLTLQYVLGERTLFDGIRKLEPAHYQVVDLATHAARTVRYWEPDYSPDLSATGEPEIRHLRQLIEASVARQMRSDVPVGAYLSGGLDSSLVTGVAARCFPGRLTTFTGAFREGPEFDESGHALAVARHVDARAELTYPTERDWIDLLPKLVYHMDEPAAGPGLFPQYMVSAHARRHVKVVLGGQGGDEIFAGYARYLIGALEEALASSIAGAPRAPGALSLAELEQGLGTLKPYLPLLRRAWTSGVDAAPHERYFRLVNRLDASIAFLSPDLRDRLTRSGVRERFREVFERPAGCTHLKRMLHFDLVTSLPALLQVEDRVSMAVSLESRVPLLDPRLVEAAARLPDSMLLSEGKLKSALRKAAEPYLPESIVHRADKMGFPVPLQRWARGPARDFVHDTLLSSRAAGRGLFDGAALARLVEQEAEFGRALWGALQLELGHRTMLDEEPALA